MSPGMRENLFPPATISNPPLGSVSPLPSVKSPGVPSKAGIGSHFRRWVASSFEVLVAADGGAGTTGLAPGSGAALASVDATSFLAFGSLAEEAGAAEFLSFGLLSSAKLGVETKMRTVKNRVAARAPNFIPPPHIGCIDRLLI